MNTRKQYKCKDFNLEPCFVCEDPVIASIEVCEIEWHVGALKILINNGTSTVKEQIQDLLKSRSFGYYLYLRKAIELECPKYLNYFDKLFLLK